MKACLLALALLWAPAAWALPIDRPVVDDRPIVWMDRPIAPIGARPITPRGERPVGAAAAPIAPPLALADPVLLPPAGAPLEAPAPVAPTPTPEPGTLLLVGTTLAALGWWKRRGR